MGERKGFAAGAKTTEAPGPGPRGRAWQRPAAGIGGPAAASSSSEVSWMSRCPSAQSWPPQRWRRQRGSADEGWEFAFSCGGGSAEAGRRGIGGGGLHLNPGKQVYKEGLVAGIDNIRSLNQRPL